MASADTTEMELTFHVETQTDFKAKDTTKRKAAAPSNDSSKRQKLSDRFIYVVEERNFNPTGRPRTTPVPTTPKTRGKIKFRKDHPVLTRVPIDIWQTIFGHCSPNFLLKARAVCTSFRAALAFEKAWKEARLRYFGPDHPNPPDGIMERQYADLLTGVGCQTRGCKGQTRKTYWAFQRRWCESCLKNNVDMGGHGTVYMEHHNFAVKCIPEAKFDAWGHYEWVGHHDSTPSWAGRYRAGQKTGYAKVALEKIRTETDHFLQMSPTKEQTDEWFENKAVINDAFVAQLQSIEAWSETARVERLAKAAAIKEQREKFYQEQAQLMSPPLEAAALKKCTSYARFVIIPRYATALSWQQLAPKLEDERRGAEEQLGKDRRSQAALAYRRQLILSQNDTIRRRANNESPEQLYVLGLTDQVIINLRNAAIPTADSDLVNVILRNLFKAYQLIDDEYKPDSGPGFVGKYQLIMDDARMVYNDKILPFIRMLRAPHRIRIAKILKCPCCQNGPAQDLDFEGLMKHIFEQHKYAPDLYPLTLPGLGHGCNVFLWYCCEWPRNLPMLADHQESTGKWNLEDNSDYICKEPDIFPNDMTGAFDGRQPSFVEVVEQGFGGALAHAASLLRNVELNGIFKAQIILEYARSRYQIVSRWKSIPEDYLGHLQLISKLYDFRDLFNNMSCLRCSQKNDLTSPFSEGAHSLDDLARHYLHKHTGDWTRDMLAFPSPRQLWKELNRAEKRAALAAFERLFPLFKDPVTPLLVQFPNGPRHINPFMSHACYE